MIDRFGPSLISTDGSAAVPNQIGNDGGDGSKQRNDNGSGHLTRAKFRVLGGMSYRFDGFVPRTTRFGDLSRRSGAVPMDREYGSGAECGCPNYTYKVVLCQCLILYSEDTEERQTRVTGINKLKLHLSI